MRKVGLVLVAAMMTACASNGQSGQDQSSGEDKVPADVRAAFFSEHPYAKIDNPSQQESQTDGTIYTIPYVRSDGSNGVAVYTSMGVLRSDH